MVQNPPALTVPYKPHWLRGATKRPPRHRQPDGDRAAMLPEPSRRLRSRRGSSACRLEQHLLIAHFHPCQSPRPVSHPVPSRSFRPTAQRPPIPPKSPARCTVPISSSATTRARTRASASSPSNRLWPSRRRNPAPSLHMRRQRYPSATLRRRGTPRKVPEAATGSGLRIDDSPMWAWSTMNACGFAQRGGGEPVEARLANNGERRLQ